MSDQQLNLMRASDVGKLPVVTIDGGEDAAEIRDVVYDAEHHDLIGFTLNKRGWFRGTLNATLAASDVSGIGRDAVMVSDEGCLKAPSSSVAALARPGDDLDVMGNHVVASNGSVIGRVVDVIIETGAHPRAVGYEVETADGSMFIPSSAQMSISGDNLVVPAEAEEFFRSDLVGFGASVSSFRNRLDDSATS